MVINGKGRENAKCYIFTCENIKYNLFCTRENITFQIIILFDKYFSIFHDLVYNDCRSRSAFDIIALIIKTAALLKNNKALLQHTSPWISPNIIWDFPCQDESSMISICPFYSLLYFTSDYRPVNQKINLANFPSK